MDIAEEILRRYEEIFSNLPDRGQGKLRFGRSMLSVSNIAAQYYCEQKLDMESEIPMPPTEEMITGGAAHEAAATIGLEVTKELSIADAVKEREEAISICEFKIAWIHKGIPIIGMVDEAWFRGGNVDLVVERKFSNNLSVYSPYHVQAQLYCLGLGEMGFNNRSTNYRIIVLKRSCHECEKLLDRSCPIFNPDRPDFSCGKGEAKAFIYPFDKQKIIGDLDWALDFWLNKRSAIPTKNPAKCRACEYSQMCKASLAK
ncbi:MAG: hypothetical protein AMJ70_03840 [Dehalococcoidia bacterium SG8_51_3]|nr:MAG: hypothetical protein AMJ70_03840 [Dehalococcoidia bacterium SG8_51_3]